MGQNKMPYFSMKLDEQGAVDIYIFGDITPYKWEDSDVVAYDLATQIKNLPQGAPITVHINSNGGDLKEGLGIYNVLKGRNVTTICEGFAASSASVIFCAGSKRVMNAASLLFIHNASTFAAGNADDLEKAADDLRIITNAAKEAYREAGVNVTDAQLDAMMDSETWITPRDAVEMGFATEIADAEEDGTIKNDAMNSIMKAVTSKTECYEDAVIKALHNYFVTKDELTQIMADADEAEAAEEVPAAEDAAEDPAEEETPEAEEETATTSTPSPALVEDKGFFGFRKG